MVGHGLRSGIQHPQSHSQETILVTGPKKKKLIVCRVPPASLSLDLTDTRACCCYCSNQLGIIIPWGLHEVLGGLRQHLLVVHTSFPPMYYYVQTPPPDTRWYVDEIRLIHCLNLDLSNQNGTKEMCIGVRSYLFDSQ